MSIAITNSTATPDGLRPIQSDALGYIAHQYELSELADRLKRQAYRGAICGPSGCGKTIMLQALGDELMAHGLTPLPLLTDSGRKQALPADWRRTIRNARPTDALLLDGYDLLTRSARTWIWFATMRAGAVIVTAKKHAAYTTLANPKPNAKLLEQLIARKVPTAQADVDAKALLEKSNGDLRVAMDSIDQRLNA